MNEKYEQAKAIAVIDTMLGVDSVFGIRKEVSEMFPTLESELKQIGVDVVKHWHRENPRKGINEWMSRGEWERRVEPSRTYMTYDRHYVLSKEVVEPEADAFVNWHIDHMSYNLYSYLGFLLKFGGIKRK